MGRVSARHLAPLWAALACLVVAGLAYDGRVSVHTLVACRAKALVIKDEGHLECHPHTDSVLEEQGVCLVRHNEFAHRAPDRFRLHNAS